MTLTPGHLPEEQREVVRAVALAYRRVMRAPAGPAVTRTEISRRDQKRQSEALAAADAEYRQLHPVARYDRLAVSGEVSRIQGEKKRAPAVSRRWTEPHQAAIGS